MMQMHYFDVEYCSFSLCFSVAPEAVGGVGLRVRFKIGERHQESALKQ